MEDTATLEGEDRWKPKSPYYDERFHGYGNNKIQHIKHLRARGYRFGVIPALGFLTHHPHPVSSAKKLWTREKRKEEGLHMKMRALSDQYKTELSKEYRNTNVRTRAC